MNLKTFVYVGLALLLFTCNKSEKMEVVEKESEHKINWATKVTYEIFIQSFADSNGDGIGDFNGATAKLDYLQDLGIEAVWLMPIMESPSYHKYDVTNYKSVHPDYGTLDEFKVFVSEAHKRGISVIIDLIINHTSNSHPWFLESQKGNDNFYRDFYVWDKLENIKSDMSKRTVSHDSDNIKQWHEAEGNEELYYGFFYGGMPDLNFDNPKVLEEVFDIGNFWLSEVGVDGFRMDAAKHIFRDHRAVDNHNFWKKFRSGMEAIKSDVYIVGEVWDAATTAAPYSEGLPVLFNFDLAFSILETLKNEKLNAAFISGHGHKIEEGVSLIEKFIKNREVFLKTNPDFVDGLFLSNHDQNRAMTVLEDDMAKAKLGAAIYLTLPGQPYIYYGEEIGMKGRKPDELIREPFLWDTGVNDKHRATWVESKYSIEGAVVPMVQQMNDSNSILNLYKELINIRRGSSALSTGEIEEVKVEDNRILAYLRVSEDQSVLVVHNVSREEVLVEIPSDFDTYTNLLFALGKTELDGKIIMSPFSSIILNDK